MAVNNYKFWDRYVFLGMYFTTTNDTRSIRHYTTPFISALTYKHTEYA